MIPRGAAVNEAAGLHQPGRATINLLNNNSAPFSYCRGEYLLIRRGCYESNGLRACVTHDRLVPSNVINYFFNLRFYHLLIYLT